MSEDDDLDASKAPLLEHLIELRQRLIWALVALLVAFGVCFYFAEDIYAFLTRPLADILESQPGRRMIYTGLHEGFFTYVKVALFAAFLVAFPIIANQIWKFVAPGLYRNERRAFLPFLIATPVLFLAGAALVYYFVFPAAWQFFLSFERPPGGDGLPIQLEAKISEYLSLVMLLMFAFGLSFQLPVLLVLLGRAGLVSAAMLAEKRKYAVVIVFAVAAVLTPPDPFTQIGLGLSIMALYEVSIWLIRITERKRRNQSGDSSS
ncbi:MAG: twin-arginine translocase subunit TatC [Alphaproteobacteria bacterium]|nr:MAG: twin-arginine translocase subunit TatC [Alphaproteobacteria bacterium]